ncbi:hypothetical protein [Solimicrobium silvestre]|uniref:Uncharacterized protein n=1 Tax=Solimicrobium silvestre TaxID=2099400 RepID=A0A2S9GZB8_9BURK|nr:hypothetical protein [Solimicrobium silvestre]PRC93074.1 hypothetical protein S2091_2160 [Solimicrobium silvestre]
MKLNLRADSVAHQVLMMLVSEPKGCLHVSAFFDLLKGKSSTTHGTRIINRCGRIISERMATVKAEMWTITERGRRQLVEPDSMDFDVSNPTLITPSRTIRPFRPLQLKQNKQPYRAGSNDYSLIPSLFGDVRKLPNGEVVD